MASSTRSNVVGCARFSGQISLNVTFRYRPENRAHPTTDHRPLPFPYLQENDVLVLFREDADVLDLFLGNISRDFDHFLAVAKDEFPAHENFHVTDVENAGQEIRHQESAARAEHLEHGPGQSPS